MDRQNIPIGISYYWVDQELATLGIKFLVREIHNVSIVKEITKLTNEVSLLVNQFKKPYPHQHPFLTGYRELLNKVGALTEESSVEFLHHYVSYMEHFPRINSVVDAYNKVSYEKYIVASAHDLDKIVGNVRLVKTKGNEVFYPIGTKNPIILKAGQWAAIDDNHVLCQMNCKQSELSKVTLKTQNLLVYVQGNEVTNFRYLQETLDYICSEIMRFNGGKIKITPEKK